MISWISLLFRIVLQNVIANSAFLFVFVFIFCPSVVAGTLLFSALLSQLFCFIDFG